MAHYINNKIVLVLIFSNLTSQVQWLIFSSQIYYFKNWILFLKRNYYPLSQIIIMLGFLDQVI